MLRFLFILPLVFLLWSCQQIGEGEENSYVPREGDAKVIPRDIQVESYTDKLKSEFPKGFVYAEDYIEDLVVDLRYASKNNFVGRPIKGYYSERLVMSKEAALALQKVQSDVAQINRGLKVFDAYRPVKSVQEFVHWANDAQDTLTKAEYYPNLHKVSLLRLGYIAEKSGHSRGSAIDLTLVYKDEKRSGKELDMGTPFDYFGSRSGWETTYITEEQRANRLVLREAMERHGFRAIKGEWWHYVLRNEPFPTQSFDFDIR